MTLHVVNGDAAAADLAAAFAQARILPWRDVLHEGPVPALIPDALRAARAAFLAQVGWADVDSARVGLEQRDRVLAAVEPSDKVVLWFEDDLYDQLQLVQVLDRLRDHNGPIDLVTMPREGRTPLLLRHALPRELREDARVLARRTWAAFTAPEPHALQDLWLSGTPALPDLAPALRRALEELPATTDGLARGERQLLQALPATLSELIAADHVAEARPFAGDTVIELRLKRLDGLVSGDWTGYELTDAGRAVLDGAARHESFDRWLGGLHLLGPRAVAEWDPVRERIA